MSSFDKAVERARQRGDVKDNHDQAAWRLVNGFYRTRAEQHAKQRANRRAIADALSEKALNQAIAVSDTFERSILDIQKERNPQPGRTSLLEGWILAEQIGRQTWGDASHEDIYAYVPMQGLLIDHVGIVHTYQTRLSPSYPKVAGTDVWGRARADIHAPNTRDDPIYGSHGQLVVPKNDVQQVNEYEAAIHSVSGSLTMEDLLASLVVRYELGLDLS